MTNICLIDDDQNILASLSLTLKSEGYNIKTFSDGLSGLTLVIGYANIARKLVQRILHFLLIATCNLLFGEPDWL